MVFKRALLALLAAVVTSELLLRGLAHKLPPALGNDTVHSYSTRPGGMYFLDEPTRLRLCFPHDRRTALANGRTWRHATDERGLRNPTGTGSEVLLLGDSFIYGHGVEEDQTVASYLRREHGWKAYNMARQGDGMMEEFLLFQLYRRELRPKKVILFAFVNDYGDIAESRSPAELARPPELEQHYVELLRERLSQPRHRSQTGHWFDRFYLCRFVATALELNKRRNQRQEPYHAALWVESLTIREKFEPLQHYYATLFGQMVKDCQDAGAELSVVHLDTASQHPEWMACQTALSQSLQQLCRKYQVAYRSARPLFEGHPENVLPGDGHLSPEGHRALAAWLAR